MVSLYRKVKLIKKTINSNQCCSHWQGIAQNRRLRAQSSKRRYTLSKQEPGCVEDYTVETGKRLNKRVIDHNRRDKK